MTNAAFDVSYTYAELELSLHTSTSKRRTTKKHTQNDVRPQEGSEALGGEEAHRITRLVQTGTGGVGGWGGGLSWQ